jgi:hypothetical protein
VLSVQVLGPIEGWAETRQVRLRGPRQPALFALLALNANHAVASDTLIESVFAGGSDLDPVEQICVSADTERFEIADRLSSLVDKSEEEVVVAVRTQKSVG